ncbi:uncharacterized protein ACBT44_020664 isoform 2-T3 [Syngnathus typhle]
MAGVCIMAIRQRATDPPGKARAGTSHLVRLSLSSFSISDQDTACQHGPMARKKPDEVVWATFWNVSIFISPKVFQLLQQPVTMSYD